jgi:hypothetical protein
MTMHRPIPLRPDLHALNDAAVSAFVCAVIATAFGKLDKTAKPLEHARRRFGDDRSVELVLRAATSPTTLAGTPALAAFATAYLEALTPQSAGADLLARGLGLNFNGAAQINVPGIAIPTADFVGEAQPIPVQQAPTSAGATLTPFKLAVIATLTREMIESSNAETMVRQVLIESTGPALDKVLFGATAPSTDRPTGLLHGIAALTPTASGTKSEIIVDDLQALALAVAGVAGNGDIVLVASPDAATALRLRLPSPVQWPVLSSASLPARTVIAVAANALVSAIDGAPAIDASPHAELHRETVPAPIVTSSGTVAYPVGSIYQTDELALRLRWPISWALRSSAGLAWMTGTNW